MSEIALHVTLIRHGATEWSQLHRHTSTTDLDLCDKGLAQANELCQMLDGQVFDQVLCSPLRRALQTAELSGLSSSMSIDADLHEWRYGDYEGLTTTEIRQRQSDDDWTVWARPIINGESLDEVATRADSVISRLPPMGNIAVFSHGHFLRIFAARWLGLAASSGRHFELDTAAVSVVGFERDTRTIERWNVSKAR